MPFELSPLRTPVPAIVYNQDVFVFAEKQECVCHLTYYHPVLMILQQFKTGIFWIFVEQNECLCHLTYRTLYSSPCNSLYPGYFFVFAEKQECLCHWTYYHPVLLTLQRFKTGIFWIFAEQQESAIICHVTDRHNSVLHAYNSLSPEL